MDSSNNNIEIIVLFEQVPIPLPPPLDTLDNTANPVTEVTGVASSVTNTNHSNAGRKKTNKLPPKEDPICKLVNAIKIQQNRGVKEYHFRPALIDGIYCYFVIYFKYRILTVESINVKYRFCYNGRNSLVPYVLYHCRYTNIKKAVENVNKIYTTYKQKNGDLMSAENYNNMILEETVLPYSANEVCCVCLENTTDTTNCGHYICFVCRDKCCIQEKMNCPICRKENVLNIYNNCMHLINNTDYSELNTIFINKLFPSKTARNYIVEYEEDEDTEEGEETEVGEESEEREEADDLFDSDTDSFEMQDIDSIS